MNKFVSSILELNNVATEFASTLKSGDIVLLNGDLGAGKTHFVKAVAKYFNVEEDVISPTFPIVLEYEGDENIFHFDLYRIESELDLRGIGFDEYMSRDGICFIEWGSKFPNSIPTFARIVEIKIISETKREVIIS